MTMQKWDIGEDETDEAAREAGIDPCDLENWRRFLVLAPWLETPVGEA